MPSAEYLIIYKSGFFVICYDNSFNEYFVPVEAMDDVVNNSDWKTANIFYLYLSNIIN